jgi:hypothetical protein
MKTMVEAKAIVKTACVEIASRKNAAGFHLRISPYQAECNANETEKQGEPLLAATWLRAASGASLGHNRAARYDAAAERLIALAKAGSAA